MELISCRLSIFLKEKERERTLKKAQNIPWTRCFPTL